jgi:phosphatidylserine decarboxylase
LQGRRNPFVAREGIPYLLLALIAFASSVRFLHPAYAMAAGVGLIVVWFIFRDPPRSIPASPLGVVSPVDGTIVAVDQVSNGVFQGEGHRVLIRIDSFGTYTARAPVEGHIKDLQAGVRDKTVDYQTNALWLQTDEGQDLVLQFSGYRYGLPPRSFIQFGERVGQGQRCAYLRLTRFAELHLPVHSKVLVEPLQTVVAGIDLIGTLPHS